MAFKVKVFTLKHEGDEPKFFGRIHAEEGGSYALFRHRLEANKLLEWPFQFFDLEERVRMRVKLEPLDTIEKSVYVIPALLGTTVGSKRRRVDEVDSAIEMTEDLIENSIEEDCLKVQAGDAALSEPLSSSKVSCSDGVDGPDQNAFNSTLIPKIAMDQYLEGQEKLKQYLKQKSLEDHRWSLKSWDQNGFGLMKLVCHECPKEFGGTSGQHGKTNVNNLFSNYKKSHVGTTAHIRNYCKNRGVSFTDHPQSAAKDGKTVLMSPADHMNLINSGIEIMKAVNDSLESDEPTFLVHGDATSEFAKCFWVKVKCKMCGDLLGLCPPKKNLEANLRHHIACTKHQKALEDARDNRSGRSAIFTGQRGRPSHSSGSSIAPHQKDLHAWFQNVGHYNQACSTPSLDRPLLMFICWGFRGPICNIGGKPYVIDGLLNDCHAGKNWFPEPHLKATFESDGSLVQVNGAFRHQSCNRVSVDGSPFPGFTCSMCMTISGEVDFRLRVQREDRSIEKRGSRGTGAGRRLDYLSVVELSSHSRKIMKKLRTASINYWSAKARIARLKVKRPTLKEIAKTNAEEHNLVKFCHNIIAAHRVGAFGGKAALWDFMKDVAKNLNRSKEGTRFTENTKSFALAMRMYGGKRMCDLFSLNFSGPSYSTIKREGRKGVQFIPGEHERIFASVAEIYRDAKRIHKISGPIPVILAEDETKVKTRVAYEQKWDTLSGFCGHKSDHVCISGYKPTMGSGEIGYNKILDSFRTDKPGGFARVVVVNPLHDKLPRLVLVVTCTCNSFDSTWVRKQWEVIDKLWAKDCLEAVGPIVGRASDGDSRRRQLMLEDYKKQDGARLKLNWPGWLFTAGINSSGHALGLHDQDYIHNGKKLINPLQSPSRTLILGGNLCLLSHVGMVYNKFSMDEHNLKQEDWTRKDRQNWASAQRVCQVKVQDCLARLRTVPEVHRERTLGTESYLQICGDYVDMFASPRLDLRSRVVKAPKVSFFFRLWKLWFKHGDHSVFGNSQPLSSSVNFISQQCFIDVQLSCHFLDLLVCYFRDKFPHLAVPLHLTGSDSCEVFFSKVGGMVGHERAYDLHELVNTANTVNRLAAVEYGENGLKFNKVHNKMENIWAKLHELQPGEKPCNLGDYTGLATEDEVVGALKEGFLAAQKLLRVLNMAPCSSASARNSKWFNYPWTFESADPKHFAFVPNKAPVPGEDGESEVLRERLMRVIPAEDNDAESDEEVFENEVETALRNPLQPQNVLVQETRDVVAEILNNHEEQGTSCYEGDLCDGVDMDHTCIVPADHLRNEPGALLQVLDASCSHSQPRIDDRLGGLSHQFVAGVARDAIFDVGCMFMPAFTNRVRASPTMWVPLA